MRGTTSIETSPGNAIRMFVSASNRRGGFPFDPSSPYGLNAETLAAMDDAITGRNLPGPHSTVICHNQTYSMQKGVVETVAMGRRRYYAWQSCSPRGLTLRLSEGQIALGKTSHKAGAAD